MFSASWERSKNIFNLPPHKLPSFQWVSYLTGVCLMRLRADCGPGKGRNYPCLCNSCWDPPLLPWTIPCSPCSLPQSSPNRPWPAPAVTLPAAWVSGQWTHPAIHPQHMTAAHFLQLHTETYGGESWLDCVVCVFWRLGKSIWNSKDQCIPWIPYEHLLHCPTVFISGSF